MAGIINSMRDKESGQPAGTQSSPTEESGAAPSEQQQAIELAAKKVLYDPKANAQVLKNLKSEAADPYRAVAHAAFVLMADLDQRSGGKLPPEDLIPAALSMTEEVAMMGVKAGVIELPEVDMDAEGKPVIGQMTLGKLTQNLVSMAIENGIISPEDIQGMAGEMGDDEIANLLAEQQMIAGVQAPQEVSGG